MTEARSIRVWDWPLRLFHWTLVIVIAIAFLSSEEDSALNQWHVLAGWLAAILVAFRIAWGFIGGEHSRFSDFVRPSRVAGHISGIARGRKDPALGHNPLGGMAVLLLLALTAVTVWTGAFGGESMEDLHELIAFIVVLGTGFAILRYDPQAFTLRRAEAFEHRNGADLATRNARDERSEAEAGER